MIGGALGGLTYDLIFAINATPAKLRGFFTLSYDDDKYDKNGKRPRVNDAEGMKL